jgi:hypothetical protein
MLAIDARLCPFHPRADEARVPPEQRTGLSECRQSGGAFDHEFTQTLLASGIRGGAQRVPPAIFGRNILVSHLSFTKAGSDFQCCG